MGYHRTQQLIAELEWLTEYAKCDTCNSIYDEDGDCMCDWHEAYILEAELGLFNAEWL